MPYALSRSAEGIGRMCRARHTGAVRAAPSRGTRSPTPSLGTRNPAPSCGARMSDAGRARAERSLFPYRHSSQNVTAEAAATFRLSTPCIIGMRTV